MAHLRSDVALLYRRAGFGATPAELDAAEAAGYEATVDSLINGLSSSDAAHPKLAHLSTYADLSMGKGGDTYDQYLGLIAWWLDKMAATTSPLREKLTLLLHGQFPTGFNKVGVPIFMYRQNEIFRKLGPGSFDRLTMALAQDPAMLRWLDADSDPRFAPNENFARELMERFTMGVGNYTQSDIREAARAFTGWDISPTGTFTQHQYAHDFGEKTFLGRSGALSGEDVVRIVTSTPASARWVTARMWSFLAYPVGTHNPVVTSLAPAFHNDLNMTNLLRMIFMHPLFRSSATRTGLVKQPIEWVAGTMRALRLRSSSFHKAGGAGFLRWSLANLGQIPFDPPSVGGWGSNGYWLSTASSLAQLNFAQSVAAVANLDPIDNFAGGDRVDAVGAMLSVDSWSEHSRAALNRFRHDPQTLLTLALTAPEYVAN
jgi:uncharacterized protein (DUF1800 family)